MAFVTGVSVNCTRTNGRSICSSRTTFLGSGLPRVRLQIARNSAGQTTMQMERTFIAIKPDGTNRGLIGEIIARFEKKGYKLVAMKAIKPSKDLAETHYDALKEKPFFGPLVEFICSGLVIAMVWEGTGVVKTGRQMIGATNPLESAPGTIRGDLGIDVGRNVIHGSDAVETAEREIGIWFKPEELVDWDQTVKQWIYE